jgi:hypothetical protein
VQRAYLASTRALSAMVIGALVRGGGPFALGVVLGAMLALLGAGRLWLGRDGER